MHQHHSAKSVPPALIDEGRRYFFYDGDDQLTQVVDSNAWMTDFQYNDQRRVRKLVKNSSLQVISDTRFVYDGWNLVAELNSELSLKTSCAWGLDLSGRIQGAGGVGGLLFAVYYSPLTEVYFQAYDGNGNIMALCKGSDATWAGQYEYGPFGELIRANGPMAKANPLRFSTKYQDEETGLVYYGYRYYSPSLGRWLSRDPLEDEGGLNLYAFLGNQSIGAYDSLGLCGPIASKEPDGTIVYKDGDIWAPPLPPRTPRSIPVPSYGSARDEELDDSGMVEFGVFCQNVSNTVKDIADIATPGGAVWEFGTGKTISNREGSRLVAGATLVGGSGGKAAGKVIIKCGCTANKCITWISRLPKQLHHYAANKNKQWTPVYENIIKPYGLKLNGAWNKDLLPHLGRHPGRANFFL